MFGETTRRRSVMVRWQVYDLRALTAIGARMALRRSIAQSLRTQYPPCRELPTEFRELLERLDEPIQPRKTNLIHCSEHGVSSKCHTQAVPK